MFGIVQQVGHPGSFSGDQGGAGQPAHPGGVAGESSQQCLPALPGASQAGKTALHPDQHQRIAVGSGQIEQGLRGAGGVQGGKLAYGGSQNSWRGRFFNRLQSIPDPTGHLGIGVTDMLTQQAENGRTQRYQRLAGLFAQFEVFVGKLLDQFPSFGNRGRISGVATEQPQQLGAANANLQPHQSGPILLLGRWETVLPGCRCQGKGAQAKQGAKQQDRSGNQHGAARQPWETQLLLPAFWAARAAF